MIERTSNVCRRARRMKPSQGGLYVVVRLMRGVAGMSSAVYTINAAVIVLDQRVEFYM